MNQREQDKKKKCTGRVRDANRGKPIHESSAFVFMWRATESLSHWRTILHTLAITRLLQSAGGAGGIRDTRFSSSNQQTCTEETAQTTYISTTSAAN